MPDILVLGVTGVTGCQTVKYLLTHPEKDSFTWAIAGRSKAKVDKLAEELSVPSSVERLIVDNNDASDVERAVKNFKVVINLVGPYWKWGGSNVVKSCALNGVHYVDITGENWWLKEIITEFDYIATRNNAIIIPSCGFDSVPADLVTHAARKTLNDYAPSQLAMTKSISAYSFKGGISGGTAATALSALTELPEHKRKSLKQDFLLSPIIGKPSPKPQLVYNLPIPDARKTLVGCVFPMSDSNRCIVQRTWGLHETQSNSDKMRYGPDFTYEEMAITSNSISAAVVSFTILVVSALIPLAPWIFKAILPAPGQGPSEKQMLSGSFSVTNVTTAASPENSQSILVKTTLKGKGDPGYYLTPHMAVESALAILLDKQSLPPSTTKGGILTPMFALGDVLIERLKKNGRFELDSQVIEDKKNV